MKLDELRVYQLSMEIGKCVWQIVKEWNYFEKDTIGKQLVRAADSVASNLSKGFGRYHLKKRKISAIIREVLYMKQKHV